MARIKYVVRHTDTTVINPRVFEFLTDYFDFELYDPAVSYHRQGTIFVATQDIEPGWAEQLQDQGYCVAISNLSEMQITSDQFYLIQNANWYWYQEHFLIRQFGGDQYRPNRKYNKLAFMPIRMSRPFRDRVVQRLKPHLDQFIWSYRSSLPNDHFLSNGHTADRHFCPDWYDQTCFSLVVETDVEQHNFITEKTFKPIAFQHPFMVIGQQHTLKHLHELGFVTYENQFDESYDAMPEFEKRLTVIEHNIINVSTKEYSSITQEKIQHNYHHFFDESLVKQKIINEIINPLLEYANQ